MADKTRNTLEGGAYKCGEHDFTTEDPEAWFTHMEDPANGHVEDIQGDCIFCGKRTQVFGIPYKRPPKPKGVVCDTCKVTQFGADPAKVAEARAKAEPPKVDFETGEPIPKDLDLALNAAKKGFNKKEDND